MALILDCTLAGKTSNSYIDTSYADEYWADHYDTTKAAQWEALSDGQKTTLLIKATRIIEGVRFTDSGATTSGLRYDRNSGYVLSFQTDRIPTKSSIEQRLQFPRNLDYDSDEEAYFIPESVKMAQCEQVIYLLNFDESAIANRLQGITVDTVSIGQGNVRLSQEYTQNSSSLGPMAIELLKPFMLRGGARLRRS